MSALDDIAVQLGKDPIFHDGRLKPGGLREIRQALSYWQKHGRRVFIVMLHKNEHPRAYRGLWQHLGLDAQRDLLLICNGHTWEAKGWQLESGTLSAILSASEGRLRNYWASGLVAAINRAGRTAFGLEPEPTHSGPSATKENDTGWPIAGIGILVLGAGAGWLLARRAAQAKARTKRLGSAAENVRAQFADVMLEAEELSSTSCQELQEQAMSISDDLGRLIDNKKPSPQEFNLRLARIDRLESELAALSSRILQERNDR